jgi:hypothetical protein
MRRRARFARLPAMLAALSLAACTSTQDVLEPSALQSSQDAEVAPQSQFPLAAPSTPTTTASAPAAPISTDAKVRFAPVVGAPGTAASPLASRLNARAGQRGIGLVGPEDASATHVMKGYFSAISEEGETTVIYVWDVTDPAGTRVHRIQGQARGPSGGADGWNGVQPATMEAIADQTVDQLATWLSANQG